MEEKENKVNQTTNTLVQQKDLVNELLPLGNLNIFPEEILNVIFQFLDFLDLRSLLKTCKDIRELVLPIYKKKIPGPMIKGPEINGGYEKKLDLPEYSQKNNFWLMAQNMDIVADRGYEKNSKLIEYLAQLTVLILLNCEIDRKLLELILKNATKLRVVVLKGLSSCIPFELILKLSELEELRIREFISKADGKAAFCGKLRILEWHDQLMKKFPSWILSLTKLESFKVHQSQIEEIPDGLRLMQTLKDFELHSACPITNSKDFNSSTMPQLKRRVLSDEE